jgi:hypothetical protein
MKLQTAASAWRCSKHPIKLSSFHALIATSIMRLVSKNILIAQYRLSVVLCVERRLTGTSFKKKEEEILNSKPNTRLCI